MEKRHADIVIAGGGIAGLTAACAFGTAGFSVICVDPNPPVIVADDADSDLRSTAFLQPARDTLKAAGIWAHLAPHATPLQIMRLADAGGAENTVRKVADFNAADISDEPFAWNLPNWLLRREMLNRLEALNTVTFLPAVSLRTMTPRLNNSLVMLSDGSQVDCRLVIAADGRNSPTRTLAGIDVKTWRFGQKGLVFCVSHTAPHDNISIEIHRSGGPFTLVPLPDDQDGVHYSSVVWMETGANAADLMALSEADFTKAANERSCDVLGSLNLASRRAVWPIISQIAQQLDGPRTALIAEAAHVIPPIGAQGLNMSLNDIQVLLDLACDAPDQLGDQAMLSAYNKARHGDIRTRVAGVNLLNRAAMTDSKSLKSLRLKGLEALHGLAPLRKTLMRKGLGST